MLWTLESLGKSSDPAMIRGGHPGFQDLIEDNNKPEMPCLSSSLEHIDPCACKPGACVFQSYPDAVRFQQGLYLCRPLLFCGRAEPREERLVESIWPES